MPTGKTPGHKGSIASPQDGRYREKNVHGLRMGNDRSSRVIKSFSLTRANARYIMGVPKGHMSHVVNRCIEQYRDGETIEKRELQRNILALQDIITEMGEEIERFKAGAESESESKGSWWPLWRIFR